MSGSGLHVPRAERSDWSIQRAHDSVTTSLSYTGWRGWKQSLKLRAEGQGTPCLVVSSRLQFEASRSGKVDTEADVARTSGVLHQAVEALL